MEDKTCKFLLKQICEENGYFFIDNSNTEIRGLWKDGIHLLESGKTKLVRLVLNNSYYLLTIIFRSPTHTEILNIHSLNY